MNSRVRAGVIAGLVVLLIGAVIAVSRAVGEPELKELPQAQAITMKTKSDAKGADLKPGSLGISLETDALIEPSFGKGNLPTLLKNLGPGTLRIGGNSVDKMFWTSTNEPAPPWSTGIVTPEALTKLAEVAKQSGWSVSLSVNLKQFDPARGADEVAAAQRILGPSLTAVEIGNEPDSYYKGDSAKYLQDYEAYVTAIRQVAPQLPITGNDSAKATGPFQSAYIDYVAQRRTVSALAQHGYPLSACEQQPTIDRLLAPKTYESEKGLFSTIAANAAKAGVPGHINETNSVACEGYAGVSDTHASAVWSVSHTLAAQAAGLTQVDYHSSISGCGERTPIFKHYTPFCSSDGKLNVRPLYYGLLTSRQMGSGHFIGLDNPSFAIVHGFAVQDGPTLRIALANVQDPLKYGPTQVMLKLDRPYSAASATKLATTSAKGLAAKNDTKLGEESVKGNGEFPAPASEPVTVGAGEISLPVAAGSVTILTLTP